jgi:predicted phage baseplate assembly protein
VSVILGDGRHGMKPSSGIENVTAKYKKGGVGKSGLLKKGQLTLLKTRPLGVKSVVNKVESMNGTEPETMENAKKNSAFPLLTMERIVSLSDFENFVNAFAGIGKSQASIVLDRGIKTVYITIASENGTVIDQNSDLYQNLLKSISFAKDPTIRFKVNSMKLREFNVEIKLMVSVGYKFMQIKDKVEHEIKNAFSFRSRQFGQDVTIIDIMKVIQKIEGINGILVASLYEVGEEVTRNDLLESKFAYWDRKNNKIFPSELLILNDGPQGIVIKEMV